MRTRTIKQDKKFKARWIFTLVTTGCFFLALAYAPGALAGIAAPSPSAWFVEMDQYGTGSHGTLKCEECHGSMQTKSMAHPNPEANDYLKKHAKRTFDYQTCKKCHLKSHERYLTGEHAKAVEKEKIEGKPSKTGFAPTCGDCHSAHYTKSRQSRALIGKEMTGTCGACHPDQKASYLKNYHGKAGVNLEYDRAAYCTDCHGAHTTVSLKDETRVLETCKRCHPDATPAFADIIIHDSTATLDMKTETKKSGLKWVHWLGSLSLIFVVGVLVFFYAHTGLLMLRKIHEQLRRHK